MIFGGVNQNPQVAALRRGIEVIVATPGRLVDLMEQGYCDLGGIEFLETDAPLIAFVRRHAGDGGDTSIACVFNLSPDPQVLAAPALHGAELLSLRSGEADLRGDSVGLSPYAAAFLRLS